MKMNACGSRVKMCPAAAFKPLSPSQVLTRPESRVSNCRICVFQAAFIVIHFWQVKNYSELCSCIIETDTGASGKQIGLLKLADHMSGGKRDAMHWPACMPSMRKRVACDIT